jgi:hypothetical protein
MRWHSEEGKGVLTALRQRQLPCRSLTKGRDMTRSCSEDDEYMYGRMNERDSLSSSFSWDCDETVSLLAESTHLLEYTLSLARTDFQ